MIIYKYGGCLKKFLLAKKYIKQISQHDASSSRDMDLDIKRCAPGEWIVLGCDENNYIIMANPFSTTKNDLRLVCEYADTSNDQNSEYDFVKRYIFKKIHDAVEYRNKFCIKEASKRIFYGAIDGIPGLVIDKYENLISMQVNSAGAARHYEIIMDSIRAIPSLQLPIAIVHDDSFSKSEGIPQLQGDNISETEIRILENDIMLSVPRKSSQKSGYYLDQADNRRRFIEFMQKRDIAVTASCDMFCYIGSWGISLLKSKITKTVHFMDQAGLEEAIARNIELNNLGSKWEFTRVNIFEELKKLDFKEYEIVICDPPALRKIHGRNNSTAETYKKLFKEIISRMRRDSYLVACSCTSGIGFEEFSEVASGGSKEVQLLDIGIQSLDHPVRSLNDKGMYLKYCLYYLR